MNRSMAGHPVHHKLPEFTQTHPSSRWCRALESITTNEPSGGDGIPVELFQILKEDAVKVLHTISQQIWKTQQWPQDWNRSVFIPIPKKGNPKECSNYCTIALISHASNVQNSPSQPSAIHKPWTSRCSSFPDSYDKEPACQCRRHKRCWFDPWVGKSSLRRAWQPTPVFLPGKAHGQRSWWSRVHRVESATRLKRLSTAFLLGKERWTRQSLP